MKLSENFTLEELIATNTGLPNRPRENEEEKLLYLASYILQPIRDRWRALKITSGYRSIPVNTAVGGFPTSQHCEGEAVDFYPLEAGIKDVYRWLVEDSKLRFGQAIYEHKSDDTTWIHVSLIRLTKPYSEALVFNGRGYEPYNGRL